MFAKFVGFGIAAVVLTGTAEVHGLAPPKSGSGIELRTSGTAGRIVGIGRTGGA